MRLRKVSRTLLSLSVAVVGIASRSDAGTIIISPAGLNPGDHYRLVFSTSTRRDATSSAISDYNSFVAAVAASNSFLLSLGATWTAIASTATVNAIDNVGSSPATVGIYQLNGSKVASGTADLFSRAISSSIFSENGDPIGPEGIWTGTVWSSGGTGLGAPGHQLGTSMPMSSGGYAFGYLDAGFYAISSEITATPEPGTIAMTLLGGAMLLFAVKRKQ